jgi:hypothetical protein
MIVERRGYVSEIRPQTVADRRVTIFELQPGDKRGVGFN